MKIIILTMIFSVQVLFSQGIIINEVMASNDSTFYDEDSEASDWIELYNTSSEQINLAGYFLSDDSSNIKKWQFENTNINSGEYLIVFASDKDTVMNYSHTNFKISASGETIILSDSMGNLVDQIDVPVSLTDISYGRLNDANTIWTFQTPTPGAANAGNSIESNNDKILVSPSAGFYAAPISVELSASNEIYYTLDGSDPDTNSSKYNGLLSINKTSILKATSFNEIHVPSQTVYQSYFINENTNLPVISLFIDPDNFFSADSGIYVNYEEDWEKPAHIDFFDDDKNLGFSENVAINIYGGYTRRFVQKSLAVKFKSEYGNNKLEYELFPGFDVTTFKSFILRNSGNDFDQTHIRDAFMQTLVKDLDIDYLEYRPAVTFINGEYWGIYNIREKISEHYVANRYGVDPDNIDMMDGYSAYNDDENDPDGEYGLWVGNLEVVHGDTVNYKQLIDYLNTEDLSTDEAYNFIDNMIDIDECLLYYAAQVYYNSQDWPANNSKYWRERTPEGKWRWILYDLDFGFNLYEYNNEGNNEDHVDYVFSGDPSQRPWSKPVESTFIPRKIVENSKIKNQFVNQVADLLNSNFKKDRVLSIMNEIADHIANDIGRHRTRFNLNGDNLNRMISFAQNRPTYLRNHVRNFFDSGSDCSIKINTKGRGKVKINSLTLMPEDLPWSGVYFQDNTIHLNAIPEPGYKFDGWGGTKISKETSLDIAGIRSIDLTATFSVDSSTANEVVINEINYNSPDNFNTGDWVELFNITDNSLDISEWYFSDSDDNHQFVFPAGTILGSGQYLVLVENDSAFAANFPDVHNYIGNIGFGLSGSGEFMKLVNGENQIIDSLTYDDIAPWPTEADGTGATLELVNAWIDNSLGENWTATIEHGTPGKINSNVTSVEENEYTSIPQNYSLSQNYPNPFNPSTVISYRLPVASKITLKVYDVLGREVASLVNKVQPAGNYSITWDASQNTSGVYFYRMQTGIFNKTKKLVLMK
ncbi:MAG: CotH kinase family protein [Bacteroidetes bacterium]|nr:CotH kinase family protein [Bacteroidota bacterium]MBU1115213.1 CotH kinase family protein [Bacteroidota bacterium]MBU1797231.1 CotH kinase family protein [Bacteroidota bacterium]